MASANPTALQIGMTGNLLGQNYLVLGRTVMSMREGGETYYWNEFNLVDGVGKPATLVYEETERGGEWKLFTPFEPEYPLTAADAATRHVGDEINLEGTQARITLVDESRVDFIEGRAPEGVEVGDVARYFNAEAGKSMVVVSWTRDEVEFFRGRNLPRGAVASAFGLKVETRHSMVRPGVPLSVGSLSGGRGHLKNLGWLVPVGLTLIFVFTLVFPLRSCVKQSKTHVFGPIPARLCETGKRVMIQGESYKVVGVTCLEIACVGRVQNRNEYELEDARGQASWLVDHFNGADDSFVHFQALSPLGSFTPQRAALMRAGETISIDREVLTVTELFQSTVVPAKGNPAPAPTFGFNARSARDVAMVRWSEGSIRFYRGNFKEARAIKAAFAAAR